MWLVANQSGLLPGHARAEGFLRELTSRAFCRGKPGQSASRPALLSDSLVRRRVRAFISPKQLHRSTESRYHITSAPSCRSTPVSLKSTRSEWRATP